MVTGLVVCPSHILTEADKEILRSDGVSTLANFTKLKDEESELCGIPIAARMQDKLAIDPVAAVQDLLGKPAVQHMFARHECKLTQKGQDSLQPLDSLAALQALDREAMARIGLGIKDINVLSAFLLDPNNLHVLQPPPTNMVLTEPEWDAMRATANAAWSRNRIHIWCCWLPVCVFIIGYSYYTGFIGISIIYLGMGEIVLYACLLTFASLAIVYMMCYVMCTCTQTNEYW